MIGERAVFLFLRRKLTRIFGASLQIYWMIPAGFFKVDGESPIGVPRELGTTLILLDCKFQAVPFEPDK